GAYVSQATLNATRPTLYLNAREDGNEVSSTSYVLRLAEQVATDSTVRAYLDSVNVTVLPMSNPDGAQEAYRRQKVNPDFMLHSGYYAALGPSMGAQEDEQDPIYPEATVEPRLRRHSLPDIFMNLHGYPSHEWVQYFSGYSAWVFSRNETSRSWWPTRGYFLTGFDWIADSEYPELKTAAFTALDSITAALSTRDSLMALSREAYQRYRKYRTPAEGYGEYFRNGVRVHSDIKGDELDSPHPTDVRDPRITPFSITTEAQDETARGDWLRLQAGAGLTAVKAALRYLYEGKNTVVREAETSDGTVRRWVLREKPVLPPGAADEDSGH
ncbi:MAG: M14 family zinc carboxypeptidase, partial [Salinibacter sp.]